MVNKRYKGHGGSAGYPKWWSNAGGNVNKGWGSTKGGGSKPPKKGGGLCIMIAPFAAIPALLTLGNAVYQSFT